jgi:putative dimethyl sulfoxide reductase chaperone
MEKLLPLKENERQALLELLRLMSTIFWGPDLQKCQEILTGSFWTPFEKIIPRLDPPSAEVFDEIKILVKTFPDADALCNNLEEAYVRLFISNRKGIGTPLYASCYVGEASEETTSLMGEPALAMKERFMSKGFSLAADISEPPDHLSIELEYLYFLLEKGWIEQNDALLAEAFSFSSETMLPWVLKFEQRLAVLENEFVFYPFMGALLCSTLQLIGTLNQRS